MKASRGTSAFLLEQMITTAMNRSGLGQRSRAQDSAAFRSPQRISITLSYGTYQKLIERSDLEGRSLSNLSAFLLESAIGGLPQRGSQLI